ncbi:MAG: restriction endonuclease subunit S [Bacteroidales bacterium]|nr:restriction endonuclease subunit S [Bacteroidales bacterium]
MGLNKIRLGDYIIRSTKNNRDLLYKEDMIVGVNTKGVFATPKGEPIDVNLKPYKIVDNGAFVYNPTRIDLGSLAYRTEGRCIVSHLYIVFYLTEEGKKIIDPTYLYIYFRRREFCREVTFRNFGSQRPEFSFADMSDITINLPSLDIQQKYVNIYNAMLKNQQAYERGLEDLKLVCDGYIEDLRREMPCEKIGGYIEERNEKNENNAITLFQGVNVEHVFTEPKRIAEDSENGSVVRTGQFAFNKVMKAHNTKLPIALREGPDCVVSNSYQVFEVIKKDKLLPKYLLLWMNRAETQRYAGFISFGTTRDIFSFDDMGEITIPIPDINIQQSVVDIFTVYQKRQTINERMKAQIKDICPILIKGSIEEGRKEE